MKCKDINKIDLSYSLCKPYNKYNIIKQTVGLDTETEKGKCFLLGYYTKEDKNILASDNPDEILNHLNNKFYKNKFNFFYNLTYDFQAIIKTLPFNNIKEIARKDRTIYKDYYIKWIPNKYFCITKTNKIWYSKFYDIAQFFNHMKLTKAGKKFLNISKVNIEENIDITNLSFDKYKNDFEYRNLLREYLFTDCEITYKLSQVLYNMITPYVKPKYFYSQASFSQQYFLENLTNRIKLPDKKILDYSLKSYQGGRFEVIKRGMFENAYINDIKSAYPYHNSLVPNISTGKWKRTKEYDSDSLISIFKINTKVYDTIISPVKFQTKDNRMLYPIGDFINMYVNKQEYELICNMGYKVKIIDGFSYYDKEPTYPYKFLERFFNLKEKYKKDGNETYSWIPKIIINGFYGKTIQVIPMSYFTKEQEQDNDNNLIDMFLYKNKKIYEYRKYKAGVLFNPIVANEITANTRVQLLKTAIKKNINDIIGFQTDSIISDKPINLDYGNKLGQWETEVDKKDIVMVGSGFYQVLDDDKPKIKVRGFRKNLNFYDIFVNNPEQKVYTSNLKRNIKLKKVMKLKQSDNNKMDMFNLIINEPREINVNFDKKRLWDRNFKNFKDVLESQILSKPILI